MPARFYFTVAEGDSAMLDHSGSMQDFKAYIDTLKSGDEKVFGFFGPKTILNEFYNADSASWRTASGIDQEKLKNCLETAKALYDADGYQEKERIEDDFASGMQEGSLIGMCSGTVNFRLMKMGQIAFGSVVGVNDAQNLYGMEGAYGGSFALFDTQEHKAFVPFLSLGLAQSAADNTYAQQFIEMAVSAKGQKQMNDGFSVNRSAFAAECENTHELWIESSTADGTNSEYQLKKISDAQQQELRALIESLDVPVWDDRVVKDLAGMTKEEFLEAVRKAGFTVSYLGDTPFAPEEKGTFGMYLNDGWYRLTADKSLVVDDPVEGLDVSILQNNLLRPILKIADPRTDKRIDFVGGIRGLSELEKRVAEDCTVAFSMYATSIQELLDVADAGLLMPPKSTWFEPKLRSGLFIHRLD